MEATLIQNESSNRRRKVTKFALAGVAVLGVGAALTSAAWSDNVFFGGSAGAADFELQGYNPATAIWENADSNGARIILPTDAFDEVGPGIGDTYTVYVRNNGDLPIYLNAPNTYSTGGALFAAPEPADVSYSGYSGDGILAVGEQESVDVTVTGNVDWTGTEYQGRTGTLSIQITGESSPIVP